MSYCDLLERMMQKDTDAFLEMTDRYGWALYSYIRKKYPNKADADRLYDETMQQFYRCMQNTSCEDPMEAMLCAFADRLGEKQGLRPDLFAVRVPDGAAEPPMVHLHQTQADIRVTAKKRKGNFWFRLGMLLTLAGIVAVIWIGIGLMMEAGLIPYYDLGYTWFSDLAGRWL